MERLQKWAHVAEIAGAVGVVVSLRYVGYQISAKTAARQSETEMNLFSLSQEWNPWYQDADFVTVVAKAKEGLANLSSVERLQFDQYVLMGLNLWAYAKSSHERGQIDDEEWQAWANYFRDELRKNEWLVIYSQYQVGYPKGFQDHLKTITSSW